MKPSNVRQIVAQDFKPEDQDMAARLGGVLNYFMRQMVEILNENVDFDNLAWDVITVDVQVDANGIPLQTTRFTSNVTSPSGLLIMSARNITNSVTYPTTAPFISFTPQGNGVVKIDHVTGLQIDNTFRLTVIVI
jgi:hypothetical protein